MLISIVLPFFNEVRHGYIETILDNLCSQMVTQPPSNQPDNAAVQPFFTVELIIALSPSHDDTAAVIGKYITPKPQESNAIATAPNQIMHQPPIICLPVTATNRAGRLNQGLAHCRGDVVVLHHPATVLPVDGLTQIAAAVAQGATWGGFRHQFDWEHWLLQYTSWYSDQVRVQRKGIVYLDHCPFVRREVLTAIGGVPEMDIFEDTALSERLRPIAGMPVLLAGKVITSARRFRQRGVYRQAFMNQWLKLCYYGGVPPALMNRLYEQKTAINVSYNHPSTPDPQSSDGKDSDGSFN